jgi:hypothetical protein
MPPLYINRTAWRLKMKRKRISFILCILAATLLGRNTFPAEPVHPILNEAARVNLLIPQEQRDEKYIKLLQVSVKISVSGAAGSGTMCHFDESSGWIYVVSCGHLWNGNKSYDPSNLEKARITVWYQNGLKLNNPKTYEAEALFWSNDRGYDVSLLRFKADWIPEYAPFARHFHEEKGQMLNSMGCDGGGEVARYEVQFLEMSGKDLTAVKNSPRPGRSGGGLINNEGRIVGVCWGSSDITTGDGVGYFTSLNSIEKVFSKNGHAWLMNIRKDLELIPIKDWTGSGQKYDRHYVPVPNF